MLAGEELDRISGDDGQYFGDRSGGGPYRRASIAREQIVWRNCDRALIEQGDVVRPRRTPINPGTRQSVQCLTQLADDTEIALANWFEGRRKAGNVEPRLKIFRSVEELSIVQISFRERGYKVEEKGI